MFTKLFHFGFYSIQGNFDDFICSFISDIKGLEQGIVMNILKEDCWIVAGLEYVTTDLPQGNDLTGIKWHDAIKGCRTCLVIKGNVMEHFSYHYITNTQFEDMFAAPMLMQ